MSEKTVARKLVEKAVNCGFLVSVNDGESWVVKKSQDITAIMKALGSTGEDTLRIRDSVTGVSLGSILLVWGNDASGAELVADHSDNPAMATLLAGIG